MFRQILQRTAKQLQTTARNRKRRQQRQRRLFVEQLESRQLLAAYTVSSLADAGAGTLLGPAYMNET
ncbi:MAG: hypothetical protein NTY19_20665 [Planctomycetota bacterium]|nr:hypothetical protein [Planctomycetota bacterium]